MGSARMMNSQDSNEEQNLGNGMVYIKAGMRRRQTVFTFNAERAR